MVFIDENELYQKQTYRNRTTILTANGIQNLSVPVIRPQGKNSIVHEIEISYAENWVKDHIKAIESAYRNSPYYQYYSDQLIGILKKNHAKLSELNWDLIQFFIQKIGLAVQLQKSAESSNFSEHDFRKTLHPKVETGFKSYHYIQTFEERHGFHPNPSILDLLFNEGPNSISILQETKLPSLL